MNSIEAAEFLGITRQRVGVLVRQGRIKAKFTGGIWIISKASLTKFKEERDAKRVA